MTTRLESVTEELEDIKFVSPYKLGKLLNVRPQMIYNYIRNGYIVSTEGDTGKKRISQKEAIRFSTKYLTKKEK